MRCRSPRAGTQTSCSRRSGVRCSTSWLGGPCTKDLVSATSDRPHFPRAGRFTRGPGSLARPRPDLEALLTTQGLAALWPEGRAFADNAEGRCM